MYMIFISMENNYVYIQQRLILGFEDMPESMAFRHLLHRDAHLTRIDFTCFFGLSIISPAFLVRFLGSGGVVS